MQYKLFTPGPITTSNTVRQAMLSDSCTWDDEYKNVVEEVRKKILDINDLQNQEYTTILMQGSGTFGVESVIISTLTKNDKLLVLVNGVYGYRIAQIANKALKNVCVIAFSENEIINPDQVDLFLRDNNDITHVAFVHCETTTGILNPLDSLSSVIKKHNKILIVDAMSSLGGIPIQIKEAGIDFIISSANKCIQGVPGFSFVIAKIEQIKKCEGVSHSLSLDLYEQWMEMEQGKGKWRFTSPTHVVKAFNQALNELMDEGGITSRYKRYICNQKVLVEKMKKIGFATFLEEDVQSPIITTFLYYTSDKFTFEGFYNYLKRYGFVIYPGKLSKTNVFRIGNIGDINSYDLDLLCMIVNQYIQEEL